MGFVDKWRPSSTYERGSLRSLAFIPPIVRDGKNYATLDWKVISPSRKGKSLVLSVRVLGVTTLARKIYCFIRFSWGIKILFHVSLITDETFQVRFTIPYFIRIIDKNWISSRILPSTLARMLQSLFNVIFSRTFPSPLERFYVGKGSSQSHCKHFNYPLDAKYLYT